MFRPIDPSSVMLRLSASSSRSLSSVPEAGCDRHGGVAAVHSRSQVEGWCLERDHQSRTRGGSTDIECRASGLAMAQRGAEDSDAKGTPAARALLETRGG